jgi:NADP-dependent 3-hydroxy acid dehydrogenase YdfG
MDQKFIFITGAAGGIGRATAELFHKQGWFVGCYDVDLESLQQLERQLGDRVLSSYLDVRDKVAFDQAMEAFSERSGGRLDIMFNNAGMAVGGSFDAVPFDKITDMVNINLVGVMTGIYVAIPLLKQTENSLCFTTSSSSATFGSPGMATYAATKHAVKGLTEALSVELAPYGCRAADVLPGIIDTALWQGSLYTEDGSVAAIPNMPKLNAGRTDASRTIAPSEVAECVWNAYHGDKLHWYVPPELVERDKAKVHCPEAMRDELIAQRSNRKLED